MKKTTVQVLREGDRFRFTEDSRREYTVEDKRFCDDNPELVTLWLSERPEATLPALTEVYTVSMFRTVAVPCLVHKDIVELLFDVASGAVPRAVVCGDCDEKITAEVVQWMAEKKASEVRG